VHGRSRTVPLSFHLNQMASRMTQADQSEDAYFRWCLANGKTYFGMFAMATQGVPVRHCYMREAVRELAGKAGDRPLRILEIGSWAGGSAITFALALREFAHPKSRVVCIDPWVYYPMNRGNQQVNDIMANALRSGAVFQLFHHNISSAAVDELVIPMRGHSSDIMPMLLRDSFDLIFIDGDHSYEFVQTDVAMSRPLIREGGIICGDDLERQLADIDHAYCVQMRQDDYVPDPKTGIRFHPGVTLAVGEAFGRVSEVAGFWAVQRTGGAFVPYPIPDLGPSPEPPKHFSRHPEFAQQG
jgi:predicted O-methyltransferase YrrM